MPARPQRSRNRFPRRGAILVLALAVVALVGATVLHSHLVARARQAADRGARNAAELDLALQDAVRTSLELLANDDNLLADHLDEAWAKPREIETPAGIGLYVVMEDLGRRFDLNNLRATLDGEAIRPPEEMLGDLLLSFGEYGAIEKAAALKDWVDEGDEGPREARWYAEQGLPQRPPNRPLTGLLELTDVAGFTRELLDRKPSYPGARPLMDHLCAIPFARTRPFAINVNTASPEVVRCILGPSFPQISETLLALRSRTPLTGLGPYLAVLPPREKATVEACMSARSEWFVVRARAYRQGATASSRVLVRRGDGGTVEIAQWVK